MKLITKQILPVRIIIALVLLVAFGTFANGINLVGMLNTIEYKIMNHIYDEHFFASVKFYITGK